MWEWCGVNDGIDVFVLKMNKKNPKKTPKKQYESITLQRLLQLQTEPCCSMQKRTVPFTNQTILFKKQNIPFIKQTVPCKKRAKIIYASLAPKLS